MTQYEYRALDERQQQSVLDKAAANAELSCDGDLCIRILNWGIDAKLIQLLTNERLREQAQADWFKLFFESKEWDLISSDRFR